MKNNRLQHFFCVFWRRIGSVAALRAERDLPVSCCGQRGGGGGASDIKR